MRVSRARISGSMLSRLGARWVTMTKAMPGSDGMALNRCSRASTPPAEAPTPTIGKRAAMALCQPLEEWVPQIAAAQVTLGRSGSNSRALAATLEPIAKMVWYRTEDEAAI